MALKSAHPLSNAAYNNRGGTIAPDTGLHRKEQAAPIDSVQELRLLRDGTHCIRCSPGKGTGPKGLYPNCSALPL